MIAHLCGAVVLAAGGVAVIAYAGNRHPHSSRGVLVLFIGVGLFVASFIVATAARTGWT